MLIDGFRKRERTFSTSGVMRKKTSLMRKRESMKLWDDQVAEKVQTTRTVTRFMERVREDWGNLVDTYFGNFSAIGHSNL